MSDDLTNKNDPEPDSDSQQSSTSDPSNGSGAENPETGTVEATAEELASKAGAADSESDVQKPRPNLIAMTWIVEGAMGLLAIGIGALGFHAVGQDIFPTDPAIWVKNLLQGLVATIPMLVLLLAVLKSRWGMFRSMRQTVRDVLVPMFAKSSIPLIVFMALMAGFMEELLFRWCLQGGLTAWLGSGLGNAFLAAIVIGLLFGFCHFLNTSYFLTTFVIGVYLGGIMIWSGSYLAPAIAHFLYDLVALLAIVQLGAQMESDKQFAAEEQVS